MFFYFCKTQSIKYRTDRLDFLWWLPGLAPSALCWFRSRCSSLVLRGMFAILREKTKQVNAIHIAANTQSWILWKVEKNLCNYVFDSHDSDSHVCKWHATSVILLKYLNGIQIWYLGYLVTQPGRAPSAPCFVANVRNVCAINKKVLISNRQQKQQPKFKCYHIFYFQLLIHILLRIFSCQNEVRTVLHQALSVQCFWLLHFSVNS